MRGVRANFTNLSVDMPPGKDAQGALGLAHAQQLHGSGERRPGAGAGGHAVG